MMLKRQALVVAALFASAGGPALAQSTGSGSAATGSSASASSKGPDAASTPGAGNVISRQPVYTDAMKRLQDSADGLRKSIQALAQRPPGPDRERALSEVRDALQRTQQAMIALPPELRSTGMVSTADYDKSVKALMASADSLRHSIQEMAQQPAGDRRNRAIEQANRALVDTQSAIAAAYQPGSTQAMGAGGGTSSQGTAQGSKK